MALFSAKILQYFRKYNKFVAQINKNFEKNKIMNKIQKILESGSNTLLLINATDLREFFNEFKKTLADSEKKNADTRSIEDKKNYFTAQEVCRMLSVSMPTLWRWANAGYLLPIMMGTGGRKKRLFKKSDVDQILKKR